MVGALGASQEVSTRLKNARPRVFETDETRAKRRGFAWAENRDQLSNLGLDQFERLRDSWRSVHHGFRNGERRRNRYRGLSGWPGCLPGWLASLFGRLASLFGRLAGFCVLYH